MNNKCTRCGTEVGKLNLRTYVYTTKVRGKEEAHLCLDCWFNVALTAIIYLDETGHKKVINYILPVQ